jgi:two-component system sensor histidine kinase KdpD
VSLPPSPRARPDPDALSSRLRADDASQGRGKLRVFFGFAPGVGKTVRMLDVARALAARGLDVAIGVVETHGRKETAERANGIATIPLRETNQRGTSHLELDLDRVLERRPEVVLVDELAHTNAPGSRHAKRWQDVVELLDAGIHVFATLNVQHLESLNDVISQVTGVRVRETVPDSVIERADEVELVDIPPDELLARLDAGKVYVPEQAQIAKGSFFRRGNLLALRELALRRTAERVDADVRAWRDHHSIDANWQTAELVLVCVSPAPASARLVRAGKRIASGLRSPWICAYVESQDTRASAQDGDRLDGHLALAESLGAEVVRLGGTDPSESILAYSRKRSVTRIVVGKPTHSRLLDLVRGSFLEAIVRGSGDIDVLVLRGLDDETSSATAGPGLPEPRPTSASVVTYSPYVLATLFVTLATAVAYGLRVLFAVPDIQMVYFVAIVVAALRLGRGPSVLAAALSVAAYDFFFVPPYFTLAIADARYGLTFLTMFLVGLAIGTLTVRVRKQEMFARLREERTAALYAASRELAGAEGREALASVAVRKASLATDGYAHVLLASDEGCLVDTAASPGPGAGSAIGSLSSANLAAGDWAYAHGREAGLGTGTLPGAKVLAIPLARAPRGPGVLVTVPRDERPFSSADRAFLETLARLLGAAIERNDLRRRAEEATLSARTEELRSSLLSAVSHDLRTPLGAITGAATALRQSPDMPIATRAELVESVCQEAERLERIVGNLLEMTRLESGTLEPRRDWVLLEELVGSALTRLEKKLVGRKVALDLHPDVGFISVDPVLIEQVLVNLLENALKYTPEGSELAVSATRTGNRIELEVRDHGQGFPPADLEHVFEKFYRGRHVGIRGVGLGLAICRAIVTAHGGTLRAENHPQGGARLLVGFESATLPREPEDPLETTAPSSLGDST